MKRMAMVHEVQGGFAPRRSAATSEVMLLFHLQRTGTILHTPLNTTQTHLLLSPRHTIVATAARHKHYALARAGTTYHATHCTARFGTDKD